MIVTVDMGNTNIFIGLHQDEKLLCTFRTLTDSNKSFDEYMQIFTDFIRHNEIEVPVEGAILSSVVPSLTVLIREAIRKVFGCDVLVVGAGVKTGLPIKMDNPNEVGADLVCDAVGAVVKFGYPCIIADLGTA